MKALAFQLPRKPGDRGDPRRANALRVIKNLVHGDARDYAKALARFRWQAAPDAASLVLLLWACPDEASVAALLATAADGGLRADAQVWAALAGKWTVAGNHEAAGRAQAYLAALDAPPPPPHTADCLARKRTLWLRRLAARSEHGRVAAAVSAFVAAGDASPAMLRAVRRVADAAPALDAALAGDSSLEKAFAAAAAAPREPRSRRAIAPPPSPMTDSVLASPPSPATPPERPTLSPSSPMTPVSATPNSSALSTPAREPSPERPATPASDDESLASLGTYLSSLGPLGGENGVVSLTGKRVNPSRPPTRDGRRSSNFKFVHHTRNIYKEAFVPVASGRPQGMMGPTLMSCVSPELPSTPSLSLTT